MTAQFPPEWVEAAVKAVSDELACQEGPSCSACRDLGGAVLAAVAPLVRKRIAEEIENDNPRDGDYWPEWHAALRWAALIAREGSGG